MTGTGTVTVTVLGTGIMGMAMARNLRRAGLAVCAWNRDLSRAQPLTEVGGTVAETPAAAAARAEVVITMLSDGPAVEAAMTGATGALAAMRPGTLWIQMSTVGVAAIDRLWDLARRAEIDFVDAPVLGTRQPAEQGTLTILASGAPALQARCRPVFEAIGERTLWLGDVGATSRLKLVANQWSTGMVALLAETVTLARRLGVSPAEFFGLIKGTPFTAPYAQIKGEHMMAGQFPPSFPLDMAHKDVRLVLEAAHDAGQQLPVTTAIAQQYASAESHGRGREDLSAIITALEAARDRARP
jgi:3-hydroxyisobutyrate dehydrogenase